MGPSIPPLILRLDITGQPVRWIPWFSAVLLDAKEMIAWNAGVTNPEIEASANHG